MSFKGITVMVPEENLGNITAADDAAIFQSLIGSDGVLSIGNKFAVTVISNNDVRVSDGVLCVGGHMGRISYGDYNDMTIENGILGENRNDIIYAKFLISGNYDTFTLEVKKGDSVAGTANDPALTQGVLYENATLREFPLWRVKLEGLSIVAVEQMFTLVPTIPELEAKFNELNSNLNKTISNVTSITGHMEGIRRTSVHSVTFNNSNFVYVDVSTYIPSGYKIADYCMVLCCINSYNESNASVNFVSKNSDSQFIVKITEIVNMTADITLQYTLVPA